MRALQSRLGFLWREWWTFALHNLLWVLVAALQSPCSSKLQRKERIHPGVKWFIGSIRDLQRILNQYFSLIPSWVGCDFISSVRWKKQPVCSWINSFHLCCHDTATDCTSFIALRATQCTGKQTQPCPLAIHVTAAAAADTVCSRLCPEALTWKAEGDGNG